MIYTDLAELPRAHFGAIAADPPWSFRSWSDKGKNRSPDAMVRQKGLAERHYATMGLNDIKAMPVGDMAARDAVLFLWAVDCMLPEAIEVGRSWGFVFKTVALTWVKQKQARDGFHIGLGYWTRGNPESCLLFTKGRPKRLSAAVRQLIVEPRREHSRKPEAARERIEALAAGPYLELFCRAPRRGWSSWGNKVERFAAPSGVDAAALCGA